MFEQRMMHNCQLNLILNHPLALGQMISRYFDLYRPFFCLGHGTTNMFFFSLFLFSHVSPALCRPWERKEYY
jgi:hypothetical protein